MIVVWDNGGEFSDHALYFIETSFPNDIETIADMVKTYKERSHIVATCLSIDWREDVFLTEQEWIKAISSPISVAAWHMNEGDLAVYLDKLTATAKAWVLEHVTPKEPPKRVSLPVIP